MEINKGVNKKVKAIAFIMTIFGIIIILVPLCFYAYINYNLYTIKNDTYAYLVNEQGYKDEEILYIDASIQKLSLFTALVEFTDEQGIVYWYKRDGGQIIQIGVEPDNLDNYNHRRELLQQN